MIHLDWVRITFPRADVVGLNDGGWLYPLQFTSDDNPKQEYFSYEIKQGVKLWNPDLPMPCLRSHQIDPHVCFSAIHLYRNLKTPLFIATNLVDGFVSQYANKLDLINKPYDNMFWIHNVINQTKESLSFTQSYFVPRCPSLHTFLGYGTPLTTANMWNRVKINGISLRDAFDTWYFSQNRTFKLMDEDCIYHPLCNDRYPPMPTNFM